VYLIQSNIFYSPSFSLIITGMAVTALESTAVLRQLPENVTVRVREFITDAFAIVAGIAWSDVIKTLYFQTIGLSGEKLLQKVIYALAITTVGIMAVIVISLLSKIVHNFRREVRHVERERKRNTRVQLQEQSSDGSE
jgi:hypothetical protein